MNCVCIEISFIFSLFFIVTNTLDNHWNMCNDIKLNYNQGSITCNLALYSLLLMAYVPLHYRFLLFKDKTICMQIFSREYLIVNITEIKAFYLLYYSLYTYLSFNIIISKNDNNHYWRLISFALIQEMNWFSERKELIIEIYYTLFRRGSV